MSDYITVPVLKNFAQSEVIGELRVLAKELPSTPRFVFSLGIRIDNPLGEEYPVGGVPRTAYAGPYSLMCVSPVGEDEYVKYMQQVQLLDPSVEYRRSIQRRYSAPIASLQQEAADELQGLESRTTRLNEFILSPEFPALDATDRTLVLEQRAHMEELVRILRQRTHLHAFISAASKDHP